MIKQDAAVVAELEKMPDCEPGVCQSLHPCNGVAKKQDPYGRLLCVDCAIVFIEIVIL